MCRMKIRGFRRYKVRKHLNDSLRRLQTDRIDLYQVHHFDRHVSPEEFWGTFERVINDGKVLYMGSSNYPGWGLAKFQLHALQRGSLGFISEQSMYSLLCRAPELEVSACRRSLRDRGHPLYAPGRWLAHWEKEGKSRLAEQPMLKMNMAFISATPTSR